MEEREKLATVIEEFYLSFFERTLSTDLQGHPQFGKYTNCAFITMQDQALTAEIRRRNPTFDREKLSEYQQNEYNTALIQQMLYVLSEGDYRLMSGFDITTNTVIPKKEMKQRELAPLALSTLKAAGLLYPGINRPRVTMPWRY